ncbi:MAG: sigma-70 family RNA polymerase sigma factor [Candidatus Hydrogenedentes bacterium]|nr:sigma-70 family RNA polymerase sigma factor [Candidatus Hydrogenedentota bacterium]
MDHSAQGDSELALALKAGDREAFEELVRRHQGRVYAVAYRLTGNREDALDVAQDAFLKAFRKIGYWRPIGGFLPWLLRLTRNQAIDHLRRRERRRHEPLEEASRAQRDGMTAETAPVTTDAAVRAREIDQRVREALVRLSPSQSTVFILRHYEGLALAEIAEQLGCTVGSVKVHLFRALKKLRKELADFQGPEQ